MFHVIVNVNSIVKYIIQIKKWNDKTCQCECKNPRTCKKDYSWNPSIADTSVTECDEIITVMNIVSTKKDYNNKCTHTLLNQLLVFCKHLL